MMIVIPAFEHKKEIIKEAGRTHFQRWVGTNSDECFSFLYSRYFLSFVRTSPHLYPKAKYIRIVSLDRIADEADLSTARKGRVGRWHVAEGAVAAGRVASAE